MKNGDISNETPPKLVVVIDVVGEIGQEEVKKNIIQKEIRTTIKRLNLASVSHLWTLGNKYGLSIELAAFKTEGWTQETIDKLMDTLDRRVANPFNYAELYEDIDEFISMLPYRPNLKGVVDLPERVARYGSYGVELNNL